MAIEGLAGIRIARPIRKESSNDHYQEKWVMTTDISANLSGKNDILTDEGAVPLDVDHMLSRGCGSPLPACISKRQQRLENRFKQEIICEYYDPLEDDFFSFEGDILSKSKDEISFMAKRPFEPEMPVLIRCRTPLENGRRGRLGQGQHAQVISCRNASGPNREVCYRIGVQFF